MKSPVTTKSDEEWESFIRKTCHDVRTPLTTLQGYSELALRKTTNELAQKVSLHALRSVFEVELFLALLSCRERKMIFSFEELEIERVFIEMWTWIQPQFDPDKVEFSPPTSTHLCVADRKKTFQACTALLLEFIQETGASDRVRINIQSTTTTVCLSFICSGSLLHSGSFDERDTPYRVLFAQEVLHAHRAKLHWGPTMLEICFPVITRP